MNPTLAYSAEVIEAEYKRLGHTKGWRLFTCPADNVETAQVALITINPGGKDHEKPKWSVDDGSAYVVEHWRFGTMPGNAPLQRQVRRMFEILSVKPEDVLSGYLVPFRSQSWGVLPEKKPSKDFGKTIWRSILARAKLHTILAFGKDIGNDVAELAAARDRRSFPAGWGSQTIDAYRFGEKGRLIVLPHLSRFGLFNRPHSEHAFRQVLNYHLDGPHSGGP